ncbi:SgcJ/EcaC family oxidoreductase [Sphingosinicella terrae]|uniref:SgcJ/EcaC family oxidoreductase n=1 Tax=Sphingosinicella terrae TaxID=2172047 RepID=UPI0013B3D595|nr:SgcJ/EcaC family oxidoreductase [Sphingosinicella terrae]
MNHIDAEAVARGFFDAWASHDLEKVMAFVAPDCVFVNGAVNVLRGADEIRAMYAPYFEACRAIAFKVTAIATARDGRTVLSERVDVLDYGDRQLDIPVAGAVVVEDGLITQIRDYFDFGSLQAQRADEPTAPGS